MGHCLLRPRGGPGLAACALVLTVFASSEAWGGEARRAGSRRGAAPTASAIKAEFDRLTALLEREKAAKAGDTTIRPVSEMNLAQLRAYQAFHYAPGGRDPMRFRTPVRRPGESVVTEDATGPRRPSDMEQEAALVQALNEADALLFAGNYSGCQARVATMLKIVEQEWNGVTPGYRVLEDLLRSLRERSAVANHRERQQRAGDEFGKINPRVDGVQWTPRGAVAVVNGVPLEAGMALGREKPLSEVRIDAIDEQRVTFLYQGFRFQREPVLRPGTGGPASPKGVVPGKTVPGEAVPGEAVVGGDEL